MNVPKLRFKEFDGEWEENNLKKLLSLLKDGTHGTHKDVLKGPYLLSAKNIINGAIRISENDRKISMEEFNSIYKNYELRKGDVLLSIVGTIGRTAIVSDEKLIAFQRSVAILRSEKLFPSFLLYLIQSQNFQHQLQVKKVVSAQPGVYLGDIGKIKVNIPKMNEQKRIAKFLELINKKIQLQQQKIDLLQQQKKGYMQKLLPELNELIPKKRFEGFTDNWSICKIKEICKISTGKGNTQDKVEGGTYPFYVRSATIERSNDFLYDQEAVLTIGDGVGTGKVFHYVNGKYNLHQRVYRMYNFENTVLAKYFYYYFSENFYRRVMAMTAKTSVDSVRMDMIAEMDIKYPSLLEQKRIVEFFNKLDNNIKLQEKKLELLQQKKQGFMQQMFI